MKRFIEGCEGSEQMKPLSLPEMIDEYNLSGDEAQELDKIEVGQTVELAEEFLVKRVEDAKS